jgi:hypothetical protein
VVSKIQVAPQLQEDMFKAWLRDQKGTGAQTERMERILVAIDGPNKGGDEKDRTEDKSEPHTSRQHYLVVVNS